MTENRMAGRVDQIERSLIEMEALMASLKTNNEQQMASFKSEQEQRFTRLKSLIISLARGKAIIEEGTTSQTSPTNRTSLMGRQIPPYIITKDSMLTAKKVELPNFDGIDPVGSIAKADQYFILHSTLENLKVHLPFVCMESVTLHWVRWLRQRNPALSWTQLV